jgi:hypothetical protein
MRLRTRLAALVCSGLVGCADAQAPDVVGELGVQQSAVESKVPYVKISGALLDAVIHEAVDANFIKGEIKWKNGADHVKVTRIDGDSINAHLALKADRNVDIDVSLNFQITLTCDWKNPAIKARMDNYDTDADAPDWLELFPFIDHIVDEKADSIARDKMEAKLETDLLEAIRIPTGKMCPKLTIGTNGDLLFEVKNVGDCNNGARKTDACGSTEYGTGLHRLCVNGKWELDVDDCGCQNGKTIHPSCPPDYEGTVTKTCVNRNWKLIEYTCAWDPPTNPPGGGGGGNPGHEGDEP